MVEKTLDEALREAGLDDQSIQLVIENKLIAQAVAASTKKFRDAFVTTVTNTANSKPVSQYHGKYDFGRIPEVVATLRARRQKVTQRAVAKELGCHVVSLNTSMKRHPKIRAAYFAALNGSAEPF